MTDTALGANSGKSTRTITFKMFYQDGEDMYAENQASRDSKRYQVV